MSRDQWRDRHRQQEDAPLPPVATGIALGIWIALMLVLAFVVVPTVFATCAPAPSP